MAAKAKRIYQFKVTLRGIRPPIWRRIQVPEGYTFWDLHVAIQDAMGWLDYHLHEFQMKDPLSGHAVSIGIPDEEGFGPEKILPGWRVKISRYFTEGNPRALYTYDFGDNWEHDVSLEKILPAQRGVKYPRCVGGRRACPPEDCGGVWGYQGLLEIIMDPSHEEYQETMEWLGGEFQPEHFDPSEVTFSDPKRRLKGAIGV